MTRLSIPPRQHPGSCTRPRISVYLALSAVLLLLSYQLILHHEYTNIEDYTIYEDDPREPVPPNEKELVFAAMRESNMSWARENVRGWPVNIYRVDGGDDGLTVPVNKGNEAMVYLTYVFLCFVKIGDNRWFS